MYTYYMVYIKKTFIAERRDQIMKKLIYDRIKLRKHKKCLSYI